MTDRERPCRREVPWGLTGPGRLPPGYGTPVPSGRGHSRCPASRALRCSAMSAAAVSSNWLSFGSARFAASAIAAWRAHSSAKPGARVSGTQLWMGRSPCALRAARRFATRSALVDGAGTACLLMDRCTTGYAFGHWMEGPQAGARRPGDGVREPLRERPARVHRFLGRVGLLGHGLDGEPGACLARAPDRALRVTAGPPRRGQGQRAEKTGPGDGKAFSPCPLRQSSRPAAPGW